VFIGLPRLRRRDSQNPTVGAADVDLCDSYDFTGSAAGEEAEVHNQNEGNRNAGSEPLKSSGVTRGAGAAFMIYLQNSIRRSLNARLFANFLAE
jgi:hypothetical protein